MGERGLDARQTHGTEEQMQKVLMVPSLVARRVTGESGLSSRSLDSGSEDRVSDEGEEGDKMVST